VAHHRSRYLRKVSHTVIQWYVELEHGIIQAETGPVFDERVLNYRIDVELALRGFDPREVQAIMMIHRDGLTHGQALALTGIQATRPDKAVEDIETRMGRAFERRRLGEFLHYIDHLRR
jgi:hypothetical protein